MKNYKTTVLNVCVFFFFFRIGMQHEVSCKVKTQIKICGFRVNSLKILLVIELLWGKFNANKYDAGKVIWNTN
jgi:hypothetical protein